MARDKKYWTILHRLCKEGKINSSFVYKSINYDRKFYFPHILAMNILNCSFEQETKKIIIDKYIEYITPFFIEDILLYCEIYHAKQFHILKEVIKQTTIDKWKDVLKNRYFTSFLFYDNNIKYDPREMLNFFYNQ